MRFSISSAFLDSVSQSKRASLSLTQFTQSWIINSKSKILFP